ncbi:MAG: hypothetical protein JZU65_06210 [Chlorobium sp.]|jgi:hypothetical protein|nr:hypothetical protein [Chlorobium sp.]
MNAVLSLAVVLIVSGIGAVIFFLMAVGGGEDNSDWEEFVEDIEIDPTDYSDSDEEYYR